MATLTGKKINTTYDGLLKTEDNQPISTTKKKVTDGYGNETGLSVDSLGNVDVSDDLNVLGNASVSGSTTANSFIKTGGTSAQFLKADGSIDSNTYITSSTDTLDSVTDRGNSTTNSITVNGLTATSATVDSLEIQFGLRDQTNSLGTSGQILTSTGTATDWKSTSELGLIDGSGTANKLPKFTDADTIGNSTITDDGTNVSITGDFTADAIYLNDMTLGSGALYYGADRLTLANYNPTGSVYIETGGGTAAMVLDASQNVGIGNIAPTERLHVTGSARITGALYDSSNVSGTSGQVLSSTGTGTDWIDLSEISGVDGSGTANYVPKWTDGDTIGNSVIYDNGTSVGIGTTSPARLLTVGDGTGSPNIQLLASTIGNSRIEFGDTDDSDVGEIQYVHGGNYMQFTTNGGERLRIDASGNVGIGTSSPAQKLDVVGTVQATGLNAVGLPSNGGTINIGDTAAYRGILSYTGASVTTLSLSNTYDTATSRIDFNLRTTGTPVTALRLEGSGNATFAGNVALFNAQPMFFYSTPTTSNYELLSIDKQSAGNARLRVYKSGTGSYRGFEIQTGGSASLIIDSAGNVGIGASIPVANLHIKDSSSSSDIIIEDSTGNTKLYLQSQNGIGVLGTITNYPLRFDVNDTERMRIDSSGRVGIGTSSPTSRLEISGTTGSYDSGIGYVPTGTGARAYRTFVNIDGSFRFDDATAGVTRLMINSTGNVGINTSSPTALQEIFLTTAGKALRLNSNFGGGNPVDLNPYVTGLNNGGFEIRINDAPKLVIWTNDDLHLDGDVIAYSTTISDQRLKDDVQTIDNALDKVSNLRGVSYTWNNGSRKGQKDLGLIAQEVEKVLPELVREKEMPMIDGGTYKTVDYEKIVGVLIEAVKELTDKVNKLEAK